MCHPIDGPSPSTKQKYNISISIEASQIYTKNMLQAHGSQIDKFQLFQFFLSFVVFFFNLFFFREKTKETKINFLEQNQCAAKERTAKGKIADLGLHSDIYELFPVLLKLLYRHLSFNKYNIRRQWSHTAPIKVVLAVDQCKGKVVYMVNYCNNNNF